jgi:uncharacterized membrane protein
MEQPKRIPWTKLLATTSCATALGAYLAFAPPTSQAQEGEGCVYAGKEYSTGACRGGQRCLSDGNWYDDANCPAGAE